jgi:hypothetical protein
MPRAGGVLANGDADENGDADALDNREDDGDGEETAGWPRLILCAISVETVATMMSCCCYCGSLHLVELLASHKQPCS